MKNKTSLSSKHVVVLVVAFVIGLFAGQSGSQMFAVGANYSNSGYVNLPRNIKTPQGYRIQGFLVDDICSQPGATAKICNYYGHASDKLGEERHRAAEGGTPDFADFTDLNVAVVPIPKNIPTREGYLIPGMLYDDICTNSNATASFCRPYRIPLVHGAYLKEYTPQQGRTRALPPLPYKY